MTTQSLRQSIRRLPPGGLSTIVMAIVMFGALAVLCALFTRPTAYSAEIAAVATTVGPVQQSTSGRTVQLKMLMPVGLTAPGTGSVTHAGTAGLATWTYKVVGHCGAQYSAASAAYSTSTGNATLTTSNYNTFTWGAVTCTTTTASYDVYRTVSGGTPTTLGKIATVTGALTYNDKAAAGDATTAPTEAMTIVSAATLQARSMTVSNNSTSAATFSIGDCDGEAYNLATDISLNAKSFYNVPISAEGVEMTGCMVVQSSSGALVLRLKGWVQ